MRINENLRSNLESYTIMGLEPGERYIVELGTKTGSVHTKTPVQEYLITKPLPPIALKAELITMTKCELQWQYHGGNSFVKGFKIIVQEGPDKILREYLVSKTRRSFQVEGLAPGTDYDVLLKRFCF